MSVDIDVICQEFRNIVDADLLRAVFDGSRRRVFGRDGLVWLVVDRRPDRDRVRIDVVVVDNGACLWWGTWVVPNIDDTAYVQLDTAIEALGLAGADR